MTREEAFWYLLQHNVNLCCAGEGVTILLKPQPKEVEFSICGSVRRIKNVVFSATKPTELDSEMVRLAVVRTLVAVGTTVWTDKFYHKLLVGGQGRIICVSQKVIDGETFRGEILTLEPPCGIHWEEGRPVDTGLRGVGVFRPLEESEILEVGHEKLPEKLPA